MSDSDFLQDDNVALIATTTADEEPTKRPRNSSSSTTGNFTLPVHPQVFCDFQRLQDIENSVASLKKQVSGLHELLSRAVGVNVNLKGGSVPSHDADIQVDGAGGGAGGGGGGGGGGGKTITLLRNSSGQIVIKGKTFDIKDELKKRFGAMWNKSMTAWTCDECHENDLTVFLREQLYTVM
jgi:hypothetical protein